MYVVTVEFDIDPRRAEEFWPLMLANAGASLAEEPGCRQFDVCTDGDRPELLFLYEVYDNRAAFDAHLQSTHFRDFDAAVRPMVWSKVVRSWQRLHPVQQG